MGTASRINLRLGLTTFEVGLSLGLVVSNLARSTATVAAVLVVSLLTMVALAGFFWPLSDPNPALRLTTTVMPSRWAFEGLLVLEADARPTRSATTSDRRSVPSDMAESFFPAATERMGPFAAILALGSALASLIALVVAAGSRRPEDQRADFAGARSVSS